VNAVRKKKVKPRGDIVTKTGRFKPEVKERGSNGCALEVINLHGRHCMRYGEVNGHDI